MQLACHRTPANSASAGVSKKKQIYVSLDCVLLRAH